MSVVTPARLLLSTSAFSSQGCSLGVKLLPVHKAAQEMRGTLLASATTATFGWASVRFYPTEEFCLLMDHQGRYALPKYH